MMESDHIRHQGAIDHQFADPMAIGFLLAQQVILRPRNAFSKSGGMERCSVLA
jgi:hypothetical protein